ncbi:unnamed protein product, partial [marine sediment metagenome]
MKVQTMRWKSRVGVWVVAWLSLAIFLLAPVKAAPEDAFRSPGNTT